MGELHKEDVPFASQSSVTQINAASAPANQTKPWNGEFYASLAYGHNRSWDEAVAYGLIFAGGGTWYTKTLRILSPNDHVRLRAPGYGSLLFFAHTCTRRCAGEAGQESKFV